LTLHTLDDPLSVVASTDSDRFGPGQEVVISAQIVAGSEPPSADVSAVVSPDGVAIELVDDGTGADSAAGDAIYTGRYDATRGGRNEVLVTALDPVQGELGFKRHGRTTFIVETASAEIVEATSYALDDADQDGLIDTIRVPVAVNAHLAGSFVLTGHLIGADEAAAASASAVSPLEPGVSSIELLFSGAEIRDSGVAGPYVLTTLELTRDGDEAPADTAADLISISVDQTQLERPDLVVVGEPSVIGLDGNGNGLFEEVAIEIAIDATGARTGTIVVDLAAGEGGAVVSTSLEVDLTIGNNVARMFFPVGLLKGSAGVPLRLQSVRFVTDDGTIDIASGIDLPSGPTDDLLEAPPPAPPRDLRANPEAGGVNLEWSDDPESGSGIYRAYVGTQSGEYGEPIEVVGATSTYIRLDSDVPHFFSVTAIGDDSSESDYAGEVSTVRRAPQECSDGIDNDGDGLVDYPDDPGCPWPFASPENPHCNDGIDNDVDGMVDFEDHMCVENWPYWEQSPCGLGAELAFVLAGIRALASRKRQRVEFRDRPSIQG
jgi:hypothetical protein